MEATVHSPSKRVRIILCSGVVLAVMAVAPAGFAASWTSSVAPNASWTSGIAPNASWTS